MTQQATGSPFSLAGRRAVVTGASSGIGAAIARALGAAGAGVVAVGRDRARLEQVVQQIAADGARAVAVVCDVTGADAAREIVDVAVERLGGIDVLVPCAGVYAAERLGSGEPDAREQALGAFDLHVAVNLRAPYALVLQALPHLAAGASIVFVSSTAALIGNADSASYAASKGGVEAMSRSLALILGPRGIRVNTIAPGFVDTPIDPALLNDADVRAATIAGIPLGRIGTPAEIGPAAVFLASAEASAYVHGSTLVVDGGSLAL